MCEVRALFNRHGLRCTERRLLIYKRLAASDTHPTAEELHDQVRPLCRCVSLATVYNALDAFCRVGLCRRIPCCGCGARYDADLRDHIHITSADGAVHDLPDHLHDDILASLRDGAIGEIERTTGVRIRRVSIELEGEPTRSENPRSRSVEISAR